MFNGIRNKFRKHIKIFRDHSSHSPLWRSACPGLDSGGLGRGFKATVLVNPGINHYLLNLIAIALLFK